MFSCPESGYINPTLDTAENTTAEINFSGSRGGTIIIPAASGITTLTFYAAEKLGGTYLPLQTSAGVAVTQTVAASKAYDLPTAIFGVRALKIVANAAGAVFITLKG